VASASEGKIPIRLRTALGASALCALTDEKLTLANLPRLADVDNFSHHEPAGVSTLGGRVKKGEVGRR
jgi:UDP-N-acetylglucosamine 1-carboxyvinyltransferase